MLKQAGYVLQTATSAQAARRSSIPITDPSRYTDYAEDDPLVASELQKAHINATFVGQSATAWSADLASGKFVLSMHWSNTSIAAYQLYDGWLNSALVDEQRERQLRAAQEPDDRRGSREARRPTSIAGQLKDLTPIEEYVAQNLPIIPTVYGAAFDEYNTSNFSGWPSPSNPYEIGQPELAHQRGRRAAPAADQLGDP